MAETRASASAEPTAAPHPAGAAEGQAAPVVATDGEVDQNVHYVCNQISDPLQDTDGEDSTFGEGYLELLICVGHLLIDLICSTESYTTSLASSITAYQHKHGRRYHAYQSGRKYCLIHIL